MELYWERLKEFHQYLDDDRVVTLDMSWAQHMRLAAEVTGVVYKSTHYHSFDPRNCDPTLGICGNVTEALANLMLGNAMEASGWSPSSSTTVSHHSKNMLKNVTRMVQFCESCPQNLLPFSIDLEPNNLKCQDHLSLGAPNDYISFPPCPEKCLLMDPVGRQQTQSGSVDIRVCSRKDQKIKK
jgi:hypothetical protein